MNDMGLSFFYVTGMGMQLSAHGRSRRTDDMQKRDLARSEAAVSSSDP
jgi:hypothetical protein